MEKEMCKIARKISGLRVSRGISQGALAQILGITQTNMSNIENGHTNVTLKNLFKIKEALHCKMRDFFEEEDDAPGLEEVAEALQVLKKLLEIRGGKAL